MKSKLKQIDIVKLVIGFLLALSVITIVSYQLTSKIPELFTGADYYYNICVQLSVSVIAAFIFYIFIEVVPLYTNRKRTLDYLIPSLNRICYTATDMYKNILNENSMTLLREKCTDYEWFKGKMELLDMAKASPASLFFIGESMSFSSNEPLVFGVKMQIRCIQANVEKLLKYKYVDPKLEKIIVNISNAGVMDLLIFANANTFNEHTYQLFNRQSKNNRAAYYNLFMYLMQLQKYCFENKLLDVAELSYLELQY